MTSEPRDRGADWRSEVESVRRMVDGLRAERDELRGALTEALEAMQANIAYAGRKDEQVLARAIPRAQAALAGEVAHV